MVFAYGQPIFLRINMSVCFILMLLALTDRTWLAVLFNSAQSCMDAGQSQIGWLRRRGSHVHKVLVVATVLKWLQTSDSRRSFEFNRRWWTALATGKYITK